MEDVVEAVASTESEALLLDARPWSVMAPGDVGFSSGSASMEAIGVQAESDDVVTMDLVSLSADSDDHARRRERRASSLKSKAGTYP